jgi:hypothetical protein
MQPFAFGVLIVITNLQFIDKYGSLIRCFQLRCTREKSISLVTDPKPMLQHQFHPKPGLATVINLNHPITWEN